MVDTIIGKANRELYKGGIGLSPHERSDNLSITKSGTVRHVGVLIQCLRKLAVSPVKCSCCNNFLKNEHEYNQASGVSFHW